MQKMLFSSQTMAHTSMSVPVLNMFNFSVIFIRSKSKDKSNCYYMCIILLIDICIKFTFLHAMNTFENAFVVIGVPLILKCNMSTLFSTLKVTIWSHLAVKFHVSALVCISIFYCKNFWTVFF